MDLPRAKLNLSLLFSFIAIAFLFQNCGDFSANEQSRQGASVLCKAQKPQLSPFAQNKLQISGQPPKLQKAGGVTATELALVIDAQCLKKSSNPDRLQFLGQDLPMSQLKHITHKGAISLSYPTLPDLSDIEQALNENPCLIGLADNIPMQKNQTQQKLVVNDPQATEQEHLIFMGLNESLPLQQRITENVIVAVVDTGVDYNHQDLRNQMWQGSQGEVGINIINNSLTPMDDDGHGTHVAGIIAAQRDNRFGVAGLAGSFVRLMAIKSLDDKGEGTSLDVYNGIQYALQNGAEIINLSVEAPGRNPLLEDALNDAVNAGAIVISATGNQSTEITDSQLFAPAYISPRFEGALSVASVDSFDASLSFFSNFSFHYAEFSAPGAERSAGANRGILSTAPNSTWTRIMGTSQSAPMVAASAAVLIGYLKTMGVQYTPAGVESFLATDGSAISPALEPYISGGRVAHLGFLAQNLETYFESPEGTNRNFTGDPTGNQCIIR